MLIPCEEIIADIHNDLSLNSNKCYRKYNEAVKSYVTGYMALNRLVVKDVHSCILKYVDPRNAIHQLSRHTYTMKIRRQNMTYKQCNRCFCKIIL